MGQSQNSTLNLGDRENFTKFQRNNVTTQYMLSNHNAPQVGANNKERI